MRAAPVDPRRASSRLLTALKDALQIIRTWHGMGMGPTEATAWALYQASPEMRRINDAIAKADAELSAGGSPALLQLRQACPDCQGRGEDWDEDEYGKVCRPCSRCQGTGLAGAFDEVWWIALNGQGQIVGGYQTKEQAELNSKYVVGLKPSALARTDEWYERKAALEEGHDVSAGGSPASADAPLPRDFSTWARLIVEQVQEIYEHGQSEGLSAADVVALTLADVFPALAAEPPPPRPTCRCTDLRTNGHGSIRNPHPECPIHVTTAPPPEDDD